MATKKLLRERIREAGGLYQWANSRLIRYAGPPAVGQLDDHTPPPCEGCRHPKSEHTTATDGALLCPV